jgi:hypothetical protein
LAEVAMPPGGSRRFVRPLLASQVLGKCLRLWFTSLPQLLIVASMICLPFFALRWLLQGGEGWRRSLEQSLPSIQMLAAAAIGQSFAMRFVFLRGEPTELARSIAVGAKRIGTVAGISLFLAIPWIAYVSTLIFMLRGIEVSHNATFAEARNHDIATGAPELLLAMAAFVVFELVVVLVYPVAAPVAVVEGRGIFAALRRSAQLTKGRRSTIFGITFVYGLIWFLPSGVLSILIELAMRKGAPAQFLARSALELLLASLACVLPVVLYHELRDTKEGFGIEDLATVFD